MRLVIGMKTTLPALPGVVPRLLAVQLEPVPVSDVAELAAEHRVPIVRRAPLARAIYGACDIGQEVPSKFYKAVAEVLLLAVAFSVLVSAAARWLASAALGLLPYSGSS